VVDLRSHLLQGKLDDLTPGSYHVILGKDLAEQLGVKVGDRLVLLVAMGDVTPLGVIPRIARFRGERDSCRSACMNSTGASPSSPCRMPPSCCASARTSAAFA